MDAARYFDTMQNAMSTLHPNARLLLTVALKDPCGNDAYLQLKQLPGEAAAVVCYSIIGRRELDFQLFRKGWLSCHDENGQLIGKFPARAKDLLNASDLRAYCRTAHLSAEKTERILQELRMLRGTQFCAASAPQNAHNTAQIIVHSFVGTGASWSYSDPTTAPSPALGAILYWLADHLAGAERHTLQSDPQAAQLAWQWQQSAALEGFSPVIATAPKAQPQKPSVRRTAAHTRPSPTCARAKSWQSILVAMAAV